MRFLLTGVTRGIGREVARLLGTAGHGVYGIVRPSTTVPADLELSGVGRCDLLTPDTVAASLSDLVGELETLDGLVHSAGIIRGGTVESTTAADFTDQYAVNVTSAAEITRVFLPALRAARGTVVFVNSTSGLSTRSPTTAYGASKFALRAYAEALGLDEPGIRVGSIYPSRTATDMQRELRELEGADFEAENYLSASTVAQSITQMLLLPPDGVVTDLVLRPRPRPHVQPASHVPRAPRVPRPGGPR